MNQEQYDIVDDRNNLLGFAKPKDAVHRNGDWHRTAHVWLINAEHQLLLQLRSPEKISFPNVWDVSAAGHVLAGETVLAAAARELKEELGVRESEQRLRFLGIAKNSASANEGTFVENGFDYIYAVTVDWDAKKFRLQPSEVSAVRWVDRSFFKKDMQAHPGQYGVHPEEYDILFSFMEHI